MNLAIGSNSKDDYRLYCETGEYIMIEKGRKDVLNR